MQSHSRNKCDYSQLMANNSACSACLVQTQVVFPNLHCNETWTHKLHLQSRSKVTSADLNRFIWEKLQTNTYRNSKIFTIIHKNIQKYYYWILKSTSKKNKIKILILLFVRHITQLKYIFFIHDLICTVLQHLIWQTNKNAMVWLLIIIFTFDHTVYICLSTVLGENKRCRISPAPRQQLST